MYNLLDQNKHVHALMKFAEFVLCSMEPNKSEGFDSRIRGAVASREQPSPTLFHRRLLSSIAIVVDFIC